METDLVELNGPKPRLVVDETTGLVGLAQQCNLQAFKGSNAVRIAQHKGQGVFVAGQQTIVDSVQMDALPVNDRIRTTLNTDGGQIVGCSEIATSQKGITG